MDSKPFVNAGVGMKGSPPAASQLQLPRAPSFLNPLPQSHIPFVMSSRAQVDWSTNWRLHCTPQSSESD